MNACLDFCSGRRSGAMQFVLIEEFRSISTMTGQSLGRVTMSFWVSCTMHCCCFSLARSLACALANWVDSGIDRTFHAAQRARPRQRAISKGTVRLRLASLTAGAPTASRGHRRARTNLHMHHPSVHAHTQAHTQAHTTRSFAPSLPLSPSPIHSFTRACSLTHSYTRDKREGCSPEG